VIFNVQSWHYDPNPKNKGAEHTAKNGVVRELLREVIWLQSNVNGNNPSPVCTPNT
jgi:hypothetical protein